MIQQFEGSNAIRIHDGIILDFYYHMYYWGELSKPHTSLFYCDFSYIIYIFFSGVRRSVYSQLCNLMR